MKREVPDLNDPEQVRRWQEANREEQRRIRDQLAWKFRRNERWRQYRSSWLEPPPEVDEDAAASMGRIGLTLLTLGGLVLALYFLYH